MSFQEGSGPFPGPGLQHGAVRLWLNEIVLENNGVVIILYSSRIYFIWKNKV